MNPKSKKRVDIVVEEGQLGWEKKALLDVTPDAIALLKHFAGVDGANVDQDSKCLYRYWMRLISRMVWQEHF